MKGVAFLGGSTPGWGARTRAEISRSISEDQVELGRIHRRILRNIAEWDRRELWRADGCADMVQWVSGRFNLSHYQARLRINCAHALPGLPLIDAALTAGELSLEKAVHLTRFATGDAEKDLLKWARRVQPSTIEAEADKRQKIAVDEVRRAHKERYLSWWWSRDKSTLLFEGALPAARGVQFVNSIKQLVKDIPNVPEDIDELHKPSPQILWERRCADALYGLSLNEINSHQDSSRATIVVHAELESVTGTGEVESGPLLHRSIVEQLKCDARLQFVLTDKQGNALGIGETARNAPAWLIRQLRKRDRHCTFPGCNHKVFVQAHHIRHWTKKGPTDLDNLVLVCDFHHDLVHKFGWDVALEGSLVTWYRPGGGAYVPGPDPPLRRSA